MGAAAGAIIGSALADEDDKTSGVLFGGIIGNMLGGAAGRVADQEEAAVARREALVRRENERIIEQQKELARRSRDGLDRWCLSCYRQNGIAGARRCTACGDMLVREKFCDGCLTVFAATSAYRYCPYCQERHRLAFR